MRLPRFRNCSKWFSSELGVTASRFLSAAVLLMLCAFAGSRPVGAAPANANGFEVNVRLLGARGNGKTKDTAAIQSAIDKAAVRHGIVVVPPGRYLCGTLHLRSNTHLRLVSGAILVFSPDDRDFDGYEPLPYVMKAAPIKESEVDYVNRLPSDLRRQSAPPAWDDTETSYFHYALLAGDKVTNVTIEGDGEIDGNRTRRGGPKPIAFRESQWISIRGITIRNAPNYNISLLATDFVEIDHVKLINGFADGIDPDSSRFVRITNSYIEVEDDAICPKASFASGRPRATEHLVVADCILRTSSNHFKFGTESEGGLHDVAVTNCVMLNRDSGRPAVSGISLESVDGGHIDGVVISNLSIEGALAPIFIRLGNRGRGMEEPIPGSIANVSIRNVVATGTTVASSITGVINGRVRNIEIDGLNVTMARGVPFRGLDVPERDAAYPEATMFGELPAVALYSRHTDGLSIHDLTLNAAAGNGRPAIVLDDVTHVDISGMLSAYSPNGQALLVFRNISGALLYGNRCGSASVFLDLLGAETKAVALRSNAFGKTTRAVNWSPEVPLSEISVEPAIEPLNP